jgi:hypothetical protein
MLWFNLGGWLIRYSVRRCLGTLTRFSEPPSGHRRSPSQSSRSHQRFSLLLVSPFLFTFASCHDITPVVTDLLR